MKAPYDGGRIDIGRADAHELSVCAYPCPQARDNPSP
jgi:hypothetical protein